MQQFQFEDRSVYPQTIKVLNKIIECIDVQVARFRRIQSFKSFHYLNVLAVEPDLELFLYFSFHVRVEVRDHVVD